MKNYRSAFVQYAPDQTSGERLNIAVLLEQDGVISCRVLDSWDRITAAFPRATPSGLNAVASRILGSSRRCASMEEVTNDLAAPERGSLAISGHREGLTMDRDALLEELFGRYVRGARPKTGLGFLPEIYDELLSAAAFSSPSAIILPMVGPHRPIPAGIVNARDGERDAEPSKAVAGDSGEEMLTAV